MTQTHLFLAVSRLRLLELAPTSHEGVLSDPDYSLPKGMKQAYYY